MGRRLNIGHTCITWADVDIEDAVSTISKLGYHGIETFGWVLDALQEQGRTDLFDKYNIPLISSYFSLDIVDPDKREESFEKNLRWCQHMQKYGAKFICLGGNGVDRRSYNFNENRQYIIDIVNELGRRSADMGIMTCFHPHTGTPIQTEPEIRALMDAVDPKVVGFAPDVAQIQKGGTDAAQIVKDYVDIVRHLHLKDYDGVPVTYTEEGREVDSSGFACYTPLGQGVVDLKSILDTVENSAFDNMVMVELDGGKNVPIPQEEALTISRDYLIAQGYTFRK